MLPDEVHLGSRSKGTISTLGPAGARRRMVNKVWPNQTQSTARTESKLTSVLSIPDLLVNVVTTDHCFNLKGRHCFSTSHQLQLVDKRAKSTR